MSLIEGEFLRGAGPVAVLKLLERGEMYGYELVVVVVVDVHPLAPNAATITYYAPYSMWYGVQ